MSRKAGGRPGPPRTRFPTMPGMPKMPEMPRFPKVARDSGYPTIEQTSKARIEDISKSDRYIAWQTSHPFGVPFDFQIHDFLIFEKRLTELQDFHWLEMTKGINFDYYFPTRQVAWNLASRKGTQVRLYQQNATPLDEIRAGTLGIHVVKLFTENLADNPASTLAAAWGGVERP